jgi:hypothetical protein
VPFDRRDASPEETNSAAVSSSDSSGRSDATTSTTRVAPISATSSRCSAAARVDERDMWREFQHGGHGGWHDVGGDMTSILAGAPAAAADLSDERLQSALSKQQQQE